MSDFEDWLKANERYLAAALAWLRARLERLAADDKPVAGPSERRPEPAAPVPARRSLFGQMRNAMPRAASAPEVLPPMAEPAAPADTPDAVLADAEKSERPPALVLLGRRLGLSEFERSVLLLCAAMELDTRTAALCARAQRDSAKPYPTFALALALFDKPAWDVLSPERPLRYWRLVEINQPGAQPLTASALRADERILNYIKGLNYLDDRLMSLLTPLAAPEPRKQADDDEELPASQMASAHRIAAAIGQYAKRNNALAIQLLGADGTSKRMVAQRAAAERGLLLYRLEAEAMPPGAADLESFARLWQRECMLAPLGLYLDVSDIDRNEAHAGALRRWLNRLGGLVFLDTREPWTGVEYSALALDIAKPTPPEQRDAWRGALGEAADEHPSRLAGQFDFNLPAIRRIARDALAPERTPPESPPAAGTLASRLWNGCLMQARPALDQLAQRLDAKATWHDIKLPRQEEELLRQIADQVRRRGQVYDGFGFRARMNRGLGISVLFAGDSGTGKTMAAEVIANELGLLLYRIDLSAVVSKYIGQTEKNLRKLFDAAEDGGAILFFDEADALFGKRSEVKDSHDRYANIEINYLLQRMEAYQGLAILATNMKSALDTAFMRRLRFIVNFPFPGPAERKAMWQRAFPGAVPLGELNYDKLARLNLTGGSIQNIALNSVFLAARAGGPVTMPLVLEAARTEFVKLEKPIHEPDFRWLESAGGAT
ncbi:MAG TPA: ATP-binding protein [Paucimonas sp.]|nr:ATP-binding protein [Paucimonas sp.]